MADLTSVDLYTMCIDGGHEVAWDYCLEQNICMPGVDINYGSNSSRSPFFNRHSSGSGTHDERGFDDNKRSKPNSFTAIWTQGDRDENCYPPWSNSGQTGDWKSGSQG